MTLAIRDGTIRGLFLTGPEPGRSAATTRSMIRKALPNLDWMVVRDDLRDRDGLVLVQGRRRSSDGEMRPEDIKTEVFLLPASLPGEKEGTFTNTHRLIQWHDKVVEPPGDSRSETLVLLPPGRAG